MDMRARPFYSSELSNTEPHGEVPTLFPFSIHTITLDGTDVGAAVECSARQSNDLQHENNEQACRVQKGRRTDDFGTNEMDDPRSRTSSLMIDDRTLAVDEATITHEIDHMNYNPPRRNPEMLTCIPGKEHMFSVNYSESRYDSYRISEPAGQPNMEAEQVPFPAKAGAHDSSQTSPNFPGFYSSTGFDMMNILIRVASRPNPQIDLGPVDMSCSFVVCDARKVDTPIIYCSATFERLTGYSSAEIIGRNCRFLQAPDGDAIAGNERKYTDDNAVRFLKDSVSCGKEAQVSLINYRKGGQPFVNLLTMIPITWDNSHMAYTVGFQIDLVEQPSAILGRLKGEIDSISTCLRTDGSYSINYQLSNMQTAVPNPAVTKVDYSREAIAANVKSLSISDAINSFINLGEERTPLWAKIMLEAADDLVHVVSLKGVFLYCSPSSEKLLEYEPRELVGVGYSAVCHPSDIVPVMRELKDIAATEMIDFVFRIRRKHSGYVWFECQGKLHMKQGKGRKYIILVGRERPIYALTWRELQYGGGVAENEVWTKVSPTGIFLYISSPCKHVLGWDAQDKIGTNIRGLLRPDSVPAFLRSLQQARSGKAVGTRHEILHSRGQYYQALSVMHPCCNGQEKATFLLVQTKLLRRPSSLSPFTKSRFESPNSNISPASRSTSAGDGAGMGTSSNYVEHYNSTECIFDELNTTRSTSWQYELHQLRLSNRKLRENLDSLISQRQKRRRGEPLERNCANCHTRVTPEWRRGPSGRRDLCNSCGLRDAKMIGRVSQDSSTGRSTQSTQNASRLEQEPNEATDSNKDQ